MWRAAKGPDGFFYIAIAPSNLAGRGQPAANDDQIIKIKF